mgnify:CR=1 FL=1
MRQRIRQRHGLGGLIAPFGQSSSRTRRGFRLARDRHLQVARWKRDGRGGDFSGGDQPNWGWALPANPPESR